MWKIIYRGETLAIGELSHLLEIANGFRKNFLMEVKLEMIEPMENADDEA